MRAAAARLFARYSPTAVGLGSVAQAAGMGWRGADSLYSSRDDLLADLLIEHVIALTEAVGAACEADAAPQVRLEAMVRAWLDHVALHPDAHRCLLAAVHLLPERWQGSVQVRCRIVLELMMDALAAAVPGLAGRTEAMASLQGSLAAALNDGGFWPDPPEAAVRARLARRIAGMLLAAGAAELAGAWPVLGRVATEAGRSVAIASREARRRLPAVLDWAAAGTEVVITRRGKRVARVVAAG